MKAASPLPVPFVCRILALWLCIPVGIIGVGALPIDDAARDLLLPLILLVLGWPAIAIVSLIWGVWLLIARRHVQAILAFALPVCVLLSLLSLEFTFSTPIVAVPFDLNRLVHFLTMKRTYDREVHAPHRSVAHLQLFPWEMDPISGSGVVYDDRDDIALPKSRRPKNWAQRAPHYGGALEELCYIKAVGSHYYIVTFGCGAGI